MRFQVYKDTAGKYRWRLMAGNNQIIANSGEGYERHPDCLHGIQLVLMVGQRALADVVDDETV